MSPSDGKPRIVLVEERGALRNLIRKVLEDAGYRVTLSADLGEVGRIATDRSDPVDLVVLDADTGPGPDRELLDEIRRRNPGCRVVLFSSRDGTSLARREPDWVREVSRPVRLSELFQAVESLVGRGPTDGGPSGEAPGDRSGPG